MIFSPNTLPAPVNLTALFGRAAPVEVDLGCGKGRFLIAHAAAQPDLNMLGTDIQCGRLQKIRARAERSGLDQLRLLHTDTDYALEYLLPRESVRTFYLFFPDPWPKRKHHRRRLVQPGFMTLIHRTLEPGGVIHIATDHADYFQHIQRVVLADSRFSSVSPFEPPESEKTDFERLFTAKGAPVFRYSCRKVPG